jgi:hypothetical protein
MGSKYLTGAVATVLISIAIVFKIMIMIKYVFILLLDSEFKNMLLFK